MHRLIKQIEIKRFRSILREKIEPSDISVFSGLNNAGKSNVLRALNLLFNGESGFRQPFNHSRDYNQAYTGRAGGKREIEIKVTFFGHGQGALSRDFYICRRANEDGIGDWEYGYPENNKNITDGNIRKQFTRFRNKIRYFYIPAIRDRYFVKDLFLYFEELLEEKKENEFRKNLENLSTILQNKSVQIAEDFKKFIGLDTVVELSSNIIDILGSTNIKVNSGIKVNAKRGGKIRDIFVNLFSSGDGILMAYIPHFLNYICSNIKQKFFIWGFEEPENSLEFSKAALLAEKFEKDFKKNSQIFITTHSPAFINLGKLDNNKLFRVYIDPMDNKQLSRIVPIAQMYEDQLSLFAKGQSETKEYKILQAELGMHLLNETLFKKFEEYESENNELKKKIDQITKPTVITEGRNIEYLKKAKSFFSANGEYEFHDGGGCGELRAIYDYVKKYPRPQKVAIIWDSDYKEKFKQLESTIFLLPLILEQRSDLQPGGIEALFGDKWFTDDVLIKKDGNLPKTNSVKIDKLKFESKIMKDGTKEDFILFDSIFKKLKAFFN